MRSDSAGLACLAGALLSLPWQASAAELAPLAAPQRRYTFSQTIDRALSRNPTALTAQQEILRSEALVREALAGWLPTLTGGATGLRIDHARVLNTTEIQGAWSLSASATLTVPLVAAQRWMQWVHAKDQAELSKVGAVDVQRSLAIASGRAYLAVIAQQRALQVADQAWQTAKAHYEFSHGRFLGGVGNRLDEVRAQQLEETTRVQAELSRSALRRAQEALGVVLAEDGPVDAAEDPHLTAPPSMEEALRDAAGRRSDVKVAQDRLAAAQKVTHDSWADFVPTLAGSFQPFYQNPPTLTVPETGWQAQLVLSVPFYDGGLRYGQRHEREALESESQLALDGLSRQVQSDVRTAFEALARADAALVAAKKAAALAEEALGLANQAYAAGATTNLEVIDAERQARDAESSAAIAEDGARQARLDMLAASGRFP